MDDIIEYRLLNGFKPSELSEAVDDHLADGWELYGSPGMCWNGTHVVVMFQAVVRRAVQDRQIGKRSRAT